MPDTYHVFHLHKVPRAVKRIGTGNTGGYLGLEEGRMGVTFHGDRISVCGDEKNLEIVITVV